jgi:hypothetical protein
MPPLNYEYGDEDDLVELNNEIDLDEELLDD